MNCTQETPNKARTKSWVNKPNLIWMEECSNHQSCTFAGSNWITEQAMYVAVKQASMLQVAKTEVIFVYTYSVYFGALYFFGKRPHLILHVFYVQQQRIRVDCLPECCFPRLEPARYVDTNVPCLLWTSKQALKIAALLRLSAKYLLLWIGTIVATFICSGYWVNGSLEKQTHTNTIHAFHLWLSSLTWRTRELSSVF